MRILQMAKQRRSNSHVLFLGRLGSTLSSFLGQLIVEKFGHTASLACSLGLSFIPIVLFSFMPETLGDRNHSKASPNAMPYDPTSFKLSIVYTA
jgi:hypothetical protein